MKKSAFIAIICMVLIRCASSTMGRSPFQGSNAIIISDLAMIDKMISDIKYSRLEIPEKYFGMSYLAFPVISPSGNLIEVKLNQSIDSKIDSLVIELLNTCTYKTLKNSDGISQKYILKLAITLSFNSIRIATGHIEEASSTPMPKELNAKIPFDTPPEPVGGFAKLSKYIEYPKKDKEAGIQGDVLIYTFITETGELGPFKAFKSPSTSISYAAYNAMNLVKWKPATQNGKPCYVVDSITNEI